MNALRRALSFYDTELAIRILKDDAWAAGMAIQEKWRGIKSKDFFQPWLTKGARAADYGLVCVKRRNIAG